MSLTGKRLKLQQLMHATLADEAARHTWTYDAVRPMPVPPSWSPGNRVVGDCSKGVQYLCRWAGGPDPMGNGWSNIGNSTTICLHLVHLSFPSQLEVGDVVTFGINGDEHAAMVMEAGSDPLLWSFGHQGAPNSYRLSWDHRVHQLLKLPVVDPLPTPQDRLRAMTGWFSWVAWRLGEGLWVKYGKANRSVRPNVPRIIGVGSTADWWKRYIAFLANRKKGNAATTKPL